jgi:hypothetical protein
MIDDMQCTQVETELPFLGFLTCQEISDLLSFMGPNTKLAARAGCEGYFASFFLTTTTNRWDRLCRPLLDCRPAGNTRSTKTNISISPPPADHGKAPKNEGAPEYLTILMPSLPLILVSILSSSGGGDEEFAASGDDDCSRY